ncbi:hypothetical protein F0L68_11390 [Solihabitans fulvus]|uniref:DUF3592 domain-containing protein n=1 Tax=Solihabitans fulvus TaxID=1892852 RepID=A0A5B2XIK9_9PSEU|nr:DUF3592 domain-containing protein [Solihabitans fulvus]KAA2262829.1 hypothetical protein F0L68_11390 [Solihabitans fulvus]
MSTPTPDPSRPRALLGVRPVRHGLVTIAIAVAVCAVVAGFSWLSWHDASDQIGRFTARATGEITSTQAGADGDAVEVRWALPDGRQATAAVPLGSGRPPVGTKTEIAYDPARPDQAMIPGAAVLVQAGRGQGGVITSGLVVVLLLGLSGWRVFSRSRTTRAPVRTALVRRVRLQSGLLTRSWLETENGSERWIPVYYDPVLVALPSPAEVRLHGDPTSDRLVAVEVLPVEPHSSSDPTSDAVSAAGETVRPEPVVLYPSGPVSAKLPRGRRGDGPAWPDAEEVRHATRTAGLGRQLRADLPLLVPAPFVGLFWAFLDDSGFYGWLGATSIAAAFGLWWAAWRGSDPN